MQWYDDDSFWDDFAPFLFDDERLAAAETECQAIIDLTHLRPDAAVLDLAAGVGRHAVAFASRGHQVTAVDRTVRYLQQTTDNAQAAGVTVETVHADMRDIDRPGVYGLALNLFTSFGFFPKDAENARALQVLHDCLSGEGCAVLDMTSKEILARDWRERDWHGLDDGTLLLEERELLDSFARVRARWTLITPEGQRKEHRFEHRIYAASELAAMLRAAGFARIQLYGNLDGSPYDHEAERLVAVAWRS